ncbi:MAG TPA: 50S ribosomal protein L11 methyltransferase, partial [Verrucomicrobiae bacterium]|nr:50S ribosomal protein L11 methyltransferase [Verrucomicrobiae bacterium]
MKTSGVSQISVVTTAEAEEPVAALLETLFGVAPSAYLDVETQKSVITAYLRTAPAALRARKEEVEHGLKELRSLGLDTGSSEIVIGKVRREDWSESWKKYFKTIEIGSALLIKPSWSRKTP